MLKPDLTPQIVAAKELLQTVRHAALATVNEDGSPHNSPVFASFDNQLCMIWASSPASLHSQNIARTAKVFIAVFNSIEKGTGLYIQASARVLKDDELAQALTTFNKRRKEMLREEIPLASFQGASPQRLYRATPQQLWVNISDRDANGYVINDRRYEISQEALV